jgi:DNA-binding NtrC family response regulator
MWLLVCENENSFEQLLPLLFVDILVKLRQQRRMLNLRVVIAEDEPAVAEVLKTVLENYGFAVTTFDGDSFDAFGATLAHELHVFVCDMKLPGVSGIALCRAVLEKYPKCEVILMTGAVDVPDTVALGNGFKLPVLLHKPFSLTKFAEMVVALTRIEYRA